MLRVVFALLLVGCESNPSVIDNVGHGIPESANMWRTIETRAQPVSARLDLLHAAVKGPRTTREDIIKRCDELIAWMDAKGSVPAAPVMAAYNDIGVDGIFSLTRTCLETRPTDDRTFESLLYTAATLRGDGIGIIDGMIAGAIMKHLIEHRPIAPAFAAKYTPTDADVLRLFAAEAIFMRRAAHEAGEDGGADLFLMQNLAKAPLERAAFLAYFEAEVAKHPDAKLGKVFATHARTLFAQVDDYRGWLSNR